MRKNNPMRKPALPCRIYGRIAVVAVLLVLTTFVMTSMLPPQQAAPGVSFIAPPGVALARCDNGNQSETDASYQNACTMSTSGASLLNQSIHQTATRHCYWDYGGASSECNSPVYYYDEDWWIISNLGASKTITVSVFNQASNNASSDFDLELKEVLSGTILDSDYGTSADASVGYTTPATGTASYYIRVYNYGSAPAPDTCSTIPIFDDTCDTSSSRDFLYNITVTIADPPSPPSGFTATTVSATQIDLAWNSVAGATGYQIEWSANGTNGWTALATIPDGSTQSYSDTSLSCGTTRYYRIKSLGGITWSSNKSATTTGCPNPLSISGAGVGSGTVTGSGFTCTITAGVTSGTCSVDFSPGASVSLTAAPNGSSLFGSWSGCTSTSGTTCNVTMPSSTKTVTVTFNSAIPLDSYEENNTQFSAKQVTVTATTQNLSLTISGPGDHDFFYFYGVPGMASLNAFSSLGMNLNMNFTGPEGGVPVTNNGTPNPSISTATTLNGYYLVEVWASDPAAIGYYQLSLINAPPTPTPTKAPTNTPAPTGTPLPTPTATATPELGGDADIAEPNNTFGTAFRIAAGNKIASLNFNSGTFGIVDIDYFVMTVKNSLDYTCETSNLGLGTDTILTIYGPTPDTASLLAAHDDIDAANNNLASQATWTSAYDGQVFVVVSQNGPVSRPGEAIYDLTCYAGTPTSTALSAGGGGGGGGSTGGAASSGSAASTALSIEIVGAPERPDEATPEPPGLLNVNIVVAYDENANRIVDLSEGVNGMSIRVVDTRTNTQIANGMTDGSGSLQLLVTAPLGRRVMVVIPFLSVGKQFTVGANDSQDWVVLLPSSLVPGLIP